MMFLISGPKLIPDRAYKLPNLERQ